MWNKSWKYCSNPRQNCTLILLQGLKIYILLEPLGVVITVGLGRLSKVTAVFLDFSQFWGLFIQMNFKRMGKGLSMAASCYSLWVSIARVNSYQDEGIFLPQFLACPSVSVRGDFRTSVCTFFRPTGLSSPSRHNTPDNLENHQTSSWKASVIAHQRKGPHRTEILLLDSHWTTGVP